MATPNTPAESPKSEGLDLVLDIPVEVTVELGSTELPLKDVMKLAPGAIIELRKKADEPVSLYVNRKLVAHGEVVLVEANLGIKITHVIGMPQAAPAAPQPAAVAPAAAAAPAP